MTISNENKNDSENIIKTENNEINNSVINKNYDNDNNDNNNELNMINNLEKRIYALELFLGSSVNIIDMEISQNLGPGSVGNRDFNTISGSVFPLIESVAR